MGQARRGAPAFPKRLAVNPGNRTLSADFIDLRRFHEIGHLSPRNTSNDAERSGEMTRFRIALARQAKENEVESTPQDFIILL
jgi:hypothetical protein